MKKRLDPTVRDEVVSEDARDALRSGAGPAAEQPPPRPPQDAAAREADLDAVRTALTDEFEVAEEVGRGGMAVVYRAVERQLGRDVAVKVLPSLHAFDGAFVERFMHEARTSAALEHPSIVPIYRVGRAGDVNYFVMKYVTGSSLATVLRNRGRLPAEEIVAMLRDAAGAIGYASSRGVVHRDIKPDNILLDDSGRWMLTDFGIAKSALSQELTGVGQTMGTPRYMSPEQARGTELDGRSDIYSLGIVAFECLFGRAPFDAPDRFAILYAHVHAKLPEPTIPGRAERELFEIVRRMLEKDPRRRFQSCEELIAALDRFDETMAKSAPLEAIQAAITGTYPWFRPRRKSLKLAVAMASIALLAVASLPGAKVLRDGRSRCPSPSNGDSLPRSFQVLVDSIADHVGSKLSVGYDVCGLEAGTAYSGRFTISHRVAGRKGQMRRLEPVSETFADTAGSRSIRAHRVVDVSRLRAGEYVVEVTVTDQAGRRRNVRERFQHAPKRAQS